MNHISRDKALELLKKYNKDPFHIQHAFTVEAVMKWYANELGYGEDAEYWGIVGLLHDIDFELYPEEHCLKAPELLREGGVGEDIIHAVCSHGYGITVGCGETINVEPVHKMEKVLFAADELTGLIWAAALTNSSQSAICLSHPASTGTAFMVVKKDRQKWMRKANRQCGYLPEI